ncbi:MAG: hypothetical protein LC740_03135 [Actinobacteria bacterium]|nr:hypothetical protein [Actinomycetota bacterium]
MEMVRTPVDHARYLHGSGTKGQVTIAQKNPDWDTDWEQNPYKTHELDEVLPAYSGLDDVYISQNRFYGSRKSNRIAELCALYADLDYYKVPHLAEIHPKGVLDLALEALRQAKIPPPSLVISTGRVLALVWRHEPVPGAALSRWTRCQNRIFEALQELGADPGAMDAARVLRLVGTYNSKSGKLVETIFENLDEVWDFGELADEILPSTQEQFEEQQARRRENEKKLISVDARRPSKGRKDGEKGFTLTTLCESRIEDLRRLIELRGVEKLPPGQRDEWMYVAGVSFSYLLQPEALEKRMIKLGREVADWSEAETRSCISTVLGKARSAADGETLEWKGQQRGPRYWLTNGEIIRRLRITPEEERHLKTLISKDTKRQRDRERKKQKRRSEGVVPREEYIVGRRESRQHNHQLAKKLRAQGMSLRKISSELGISHMQVKRLLESMKSEE